MTAGEVNFDVVSITSRLANGVRRLASRKPANGMAFFYGFLIRRGKAHVGRNNINNGVGR